MTRGLILALSLFGFQATALADTGPACPTPPKQAEVCESGKVSRQKLVNYALDSCGVTRNLENRLMASGQIVPNPPAPHAPLTSEERLLLSDPCAAAKLCKDEESGALAGAKIVIDYMLNQGAPAFSNPAAVSTAQAYFMGSAELKCAVDSNQKPVEAPGVIPASKGWTPPKQLRLRGSTDNLAFANNTPQFSSSDKASVSFGYTSGNTTRADKMTAFLGYAILDPLDSPPYGLVPYVGITRNISRPTGKPISVSADTDDFGLVNAFLFRTDEGPSPIAHWITLRPDFLVDHKDDSHLVTLSAIYTPIRNYFEQCAFCPNSYWPLNPSQQLALEPILDLRSDFGHYPQSGNASGTDYRNYWRVGPRVGVSLNSSYPDLPIDLTVTDVFLDGLSGQLPHLNYFKSVLSWRLVGKNVSLDASFSHGQREDTGVFEHQWSIGLSAAY